MLSTSFLAETDLLILGAGVAGIYAALWAEAEGARTLVVSKDPLPSGSTPWAQGGIAFPLDAADVEAHLQDTLQAGRGLVEVEVARSILQEAPFHLERLLSWGLPFHPEPVREGGHSRARIRHLGGDRSGLWLLQGLLARLNKPPLQGYTALSLLMAGDRVGGALLLGPDGPLQVKAGAVLLATGGFGSLFPLSTAPPGASGDGMALAWRAGAVLRDLEFVQFHPTALPNGALVSEAARGAGAVLLNAWGERFMPCYTELGELAPRDVVAQAVFWERQRTGGVYLDLRAVPELEERFPTVVASARALGLDPGKDLLPVAPAAHYVMGGVRTDAFGFTGLPGLYAAGEVASTGLHGANRLASNSLLEGLVMGKRAALAALRDLQEPPLQVQALPVLTAPPSLLPELRQQVGEALGVVRQGERLRAFLAFAEALPLEEKPWASREEVEAGSLLLLARLVGQGALLREESRGSHFRRDFPQEGEPFHTEAWGSTLKQTPLGLAAAPEGDPA
ncbi:FAD-binding protein [Synechococcus sp. H60.4]|uniref:L-aspartate oxidase n=1 Tax=Synechococcus sp. H60.4 TaxID=2964519 RepID=UPI0039C0EBE3